MKKWILSLALALAPLLAGADDAAQAPDAVVKESADAVRTLVQERRQEFATDPEALYAEVEALVRPIFDLGYAAVLVLGRAGRDATPEQRKRFAEALHQALIRKYADNLLEYTDWEIEYLPFRADEDAERVRVRTRIVLADGRRIPVDYLLHRTDEGWKAYDVSVEGISYVTNYRNQFGSEIADKGIDAVIARLENVDSEDDEITDAESPTG